VLLVLNDTGSTDRLAEALGRFGLGVSTAFSTAEAMAAALDDPPDVALVDADFEGADDLRVWIQRRYAATVCFVHEFDRGASGPPRAADDSAADEWTGQEPDADELVSNELVSMLLSALANVKAARTRAGPT
jgi:hypothetical protein